MRLFLLLFRDLRTRQLRRKAYRHEIRVRARCGVSFLWPSLALSNTCGGAMATTTSAWAFWAYPFGQAVNGGDTL